MHDLPVEYHAAPLRGRYRAPLRVVTYNIERGRRLDNILARWREHHARHNDVLLLSEADIGMARSGNRHVVREFARALGYSWVFAAEFRELTKGSRRERRCRAHLEDKRIRIGADIFARQPHFPLCIADDSPPTSRRCARLG